LKDLSLGLGEINLSKVTLILDRDLVVELSRKELSLDLSNVAFLPAEHDQDLPAASVP
jgi:hypothetical protein